MKALPIILGIIIIGLLGVLIFVPAKKASVTPASSENATSSDVNVSQNASTSEDRHSGAPQATYYNYTSTKGKIVKASIAPHQVLTFAPTLMFTGNIPAGWAFEGTFPVQVTDANGHEVARGQATVPNWMSPTGAWYSVTVTGMNKPDTATGFIVIKNDNPSDLRENDDQVRIPVKF